MEDNKTNTLMFFVVNYSSKTKKFTVKRAGNNLRNWVNENNELNTIKEDYMGDYIGFFETASEMEALNKAKELLCS